MAKSDTPFICLKDISLTLPNQAGKVEILKKISFEAERGEKIAIIGPSGSGKSSLMMIMAGLQKASQGNAVVAGISIDALTENGLTEFRRENIGIVFQNFHLVPTMTALENTALPLEFAGKDAAFQQAQSVLEKVDLGHRLTHYPSQLSGGEQQRVALARAIVGHPRLLLADEPTGNLDQETGEHIIELLFSLAQDNNTTLILITHDPNLAARCSRQIKLVDGHIEQDSAA